MKYRDILGYSKKQPKNKVVKESQKFSVADVLKEEFGNLSEFKSFSDRFHNSDTIRIKGKKEHQRIMKYLDKIKWPYYDGGFGDGAQHIQFVNTKQAMMIRQRLEKKGFKIIDPNTEGKLSEGPAYEWDKVYSNAEKAYWQFQKSIDELGRFSTKHTGEKTDQKIFEKQWKKQVVPFYKLMKSWIRGKL
jgi:hypothetical protein